MMNKLKRLGVLSAVACLAAGCGTALDTAPPNATEILFTEDADPTVAALPFAEDELLVQPYPGADGQALAALYADVGATVAEELADIGMTVLQVSPDGFYMVAQRLAESGLIETVQKNYVYEANEVPNDPMFDRQVHLAQIHAEDAWDMTVGSEEVIIAIVDTGVYQGHTDLAYKVIGGWNAYNGNSDYSDVQGHGTLVAGVAAAHTDNGTGVAGVAWDCPLLAIRVSNDLGQSSARHIAAGILWALANGADVINVSFAPLWSNRVVRAAAQEAYNRGALVVISAGNSGTTTLSRGYSEALFVGAITASGGIASFSDRGPFVDLVAPGTGIRSTEYDGGYGLANGTSFSAPSVSGVAALAWSVNPDLRPVSIRTAILATAVDLGAEGKDSLHGFGAIDAVAAVEAAALTVFEADDTSPTVQVIRPSGGADIYGRYAALATASDQWGVADVVLSVDGVPYATDTRSPYRFVIDTSRFPPGPHELSFVATDLAGNASEAETLTVTFRTSSGSTSESSATITFSTPSDGATVSGNVSIRATVTDSDGLVTVEWLVDGTSVLVSTASGTSCGVSYTWRTGSEESGAHTITLMATDTMGNRTTNDLDLIVGG
jgi:subtilisin family serine protease